LLRARPHLGIKTPKGSINKVARAPQATWATKTGDIAKDMAAGDTESGVEVEIDEDEAESEAG
jgi:hypothetical protein